MDRRTFIGRVAGGLLALPLPAQAQQAGYAISLGQELGDMARDAPARTGYVEGRNLHMEADRVMDDLKIPKLLLLRADEVVQ